MKGDSKMRKRYCSMCGRLMDEHIDETQENRSYSVMFRCMYRCCMAKCYETIKNGVQPQWTAAVLRRKSKAFEYHNQIVNLLNKKFTQKQIAEALGISHGTVYSSLKQYGREFI